MYLHRITGTGLGAISELRRMWNEEVLPALRSRELVAGRGIRLRKLPAGTTIEVVDSGGRAAGGGVGEIRMVAVTVNPAGGFGAAGGKDIVANSDGSYTITSGGATVGFTTLFV